MTQEPMTPERLEELRAIGDDPSAIECKLTRGWRELVKEIDRHSRAIEEMAHERLFVAYVEEGDAAFGPGWIYLVLDEGLDSPWHGPLDSPIAAALAGVDKIDSTKEAAQ